MALTRGSILGLAMGERRILVAESAGRSARTATLDLVADAWADPASIGRELHALLSSRGMPARRAVVGLPAMWLMSRMYALPPQVDDPSTAAGILRLQTERMFAVDERTLTLDYLMIDQREAIVYATPRARFEQVSAVCAAAGLDMVAMTGSTMALAMTAPADGVVLQDGEVALRQHGQVRAVRPISLDTLEPQLRRLMATDEAFADAGDGRLTVYDAAGLGDEPYRQAAARLGMADRLSIQSSINGSSAAARYAPAVALTHAHPDWIDFLHSRLAAQPKPRFDRRARVATMLVVLLLLIGGGFWMTWQQRAATVTDLQAQLTAIADQVDDSEQFVAMVQRADGWFADRPAMLDCMLELTRAFPMDDRIWARDLTLDADLAGSLTGQARSNQAVLDLREALQRSDPFSDVKLIYMRTATRGDEVIAFALAFRFVATAREVTP